MKTPIRPTIITFLSLAALVMLGGCNSSAGGAQAANASSQLCSNISGPLAIQYDVQNGIPTAALTSVPTIATVGGNYIHPRYPALGFIYPPGWTPATDQDPNTIGVNLLRDDQQAIWRWAAIQVPAGTSPRSIRDLEVNQMFQFFGSSGNVNTVCVNENASQPAPGVNSAFSSALLQWDNRTAIVVASASYVEGLPAGTAFVVVTSGPTAEMNDLIFSTFLPLHFQLLVGNESIQDSDGDGVADPNDPFPFDPTR